MAEFDLVIKDGTVVDGARNPRYRADVAIRDGRVAGIGSYDAAGAARVIDATGLIVAPGFVDLHTHYDSQVFWDPYCSISGWHGVTSVVIGNCGFGFAPVEPEFRERAMLTMTRVEAIPLVCMQQGMPWDWVSFPEFLDSLDRTPKALNVLPYVPLGPLLTWVLGFDDAKAGRLPTDAEHQQLAKLLDEAMDAGGCGWSAQRFHPDSGANPQRDFDGTPMVTDVMHHETALFLARALRRRNEGFIQMSLATGDPEGDLRHIEALAEVSRRPVIYNAVNANGYRPEALEAQLDWLRDCRERGLRVHGQAITTDTAMTFTFEDWNNWDDSDAWREVTLGTPQERLAKMADPAHRAELKKKENRPMLSAPLTDVVVVRGQTAETRAFEDLTIRDVAERTGKHPVDAICDIAVADRLETVFYLRGIETREAMRTLLADDFLIPGISDGGSHTKFFTAGRYPTEYVASYVRDEGWLSLEEAHWRLSAFPAYCAGVRDRGVLREGAPADVLVYDLERLRPTGQEIVHDLPGGEWRRIERAEGYRYVLCNGEVTIEDDRETGTTPGRLLRHGRAGPA